MLKRILALILILTLGPNVLAAYAAVEGHLPYERAERKFITFPTMDKWKGHFTNVKKWIIVTPENLEENWEMVAARGDTEAEIRARYAQETFLFEAYSPELPEDACFRAEVFETEATRDIWHLRHWNSSDRKKIDEYLQSGLMLPDRDIYSLSTSGTNANICLKGFFTNYPPATHESGRVRLHVYNGRLYVFSYCVSGRFAGASRWYTATEKAAYHKTPNDSLETSFQGEALPRMPKYELESAFPATVAPGTVTVTGTVESGSAMTATLDGEAISATVDKKGNFTVKLPLNEVGERKVVFTVTNKKYTTRTMEYTVTVSETVTPLTVTEEPDVLSVIGELTLAGLTGPNAALTFTLNEEEPVTFTADGEGKFSHTFQVEEKGNYTAKLTAAEEGKEENGREWVFAADYETTKEGINAFSENLTDASFKTICANVEEHIGERVKISILTKAVTINEQGLGLLCVYNAKEEKDQTPLYVNVPGYAQCQIGERMILTIYATVDGTRVLFDEDGEEEERIELTAEYGTYLVYK